jgi:hypothetical protein
LKKEKMTMWEFLPTISRYKVSEWCNPTTTHPSLWLAVGNSAIHAALKAALSPEVACIIRKKQDFVV